MSITAWARKKRNKWGRRILNAAKRVSVLVQYQYINKIDAEDKQIRLMNYGWIDPETKAPIMPLEPEDEVDRHSLQLYHRVASAVDLRDKDVLEVGCGRGGGAAYIAKYLGPRKLHGVDLCPSSVEFCREQWQLPNLWFSQSSAESLKLDSESFDAVINIESSHCYTSMNAFTKNVFRVLKPGGYFLFADFRPTPKMEELRSDLLKPGFELLEEEDLNPGVLLALDAEDARKRAFIEDKVSLRRRPMFEMFAAVKDSPMYRAFEFGDAQYVRYTLRKPE